VGGGEARGKGAPAGDQPGLDRGQME